LYQVGLIEENLGRFWITIVMERIKLKIIESHEQRNNELRGYFKA